MGFQELALLLLLFFPLCSAQSTYYVTPTPETPCPGQPCFSFSEYISGEAGLLNSADLTFMFLPGDHVINNSIPFGQLANLNLFGDSASFPEVTSMIICSQPTSFTFSQISWFNISGIAFKSCGSFYDPSMKIKQVFQAKISNCLFQGGQNGALAVVDSSLVLQENRFENNSATSARGGGVYMKNCIANVSENVFVNNSAGEGGGGVYLEDSMAHFAGNVFENNMVDYGEGGALAIESNSTANVSGNNFTNNNAYDGGGVYLEDSMAHFASNVFKNNIADYGEGGALAIESNSNANVSGNHFSNNAAYEGGGVYLEDSMVHFASNVFKNNIADYGGALEIESNSKANVSGNHFSSNAAYNGGGVYLEDSMAHFASNVFKNNTANYGGALEIESNSKANVSGNHFSSNAAYDGGGVYLKDSMAHFASNVFKNNTADYGEGGALAIESNSTANVSGNNFTNNNAFEGGGVYLEDSMAHFAGNMFKNNTADYGGALDIESSHINISDNLFTNNSATSLDGGGVYMRDSTANMNGNIFTHNRAESGGGVYFEFCTVSLNSNLFKNNTASVYGGGIDMYGDSNVTATNNTFTRNTAGIDGGGIRIDLGVDLVATFLGNIFDHNMAQSAGGGVAVYNTPVSFRLDSFTFNIAGGAGGGIWITGGIINVTGSNFTGNVASEKGGASYLESDTAYFHENLFVNNSALFNGAGIYIALDTYSFECTNNTFRNNWGGGWVLFIEDSNRTSALLSQNTFENNTGIVVYGSSKETPSIYHITPSPDTVCPNEPCLTISEFIDQANQYIALNTTLMFLPGTHTVKNSLLVDLEDIASLTLLGMKSNSSVESLPLIICDRPASLGFKHINEFLAHSLAFDSCGDGTYAAFSMKSVSRIEISDCTFKNSIGGGGAVVVANCNTLNITKTVFENNSAIFGGGLYVSDSAADFIENIFTNNTARVGGAGIMLLSSNATYTGMTTFRNNSVSVTGREVVDNDREFRGIFSTSADEARFAGGAMLVSNSEVMSPGNIRIENSNAIYGGGIAAFESNLTFRSTVDVRDNTAIYGGSVYFLGSNITFGGLTNFSNNHAGDSGGAVYAIQNSKLYIEGKVSFKNNTAMKGGGICILESVVSFIGPTDFANNRAKGSGGAVYAIESSELYFEGNSSFKDNTAAKGGGLYLAHSSLCYFSATELQLCFVQNYASENGGGIYVDDTRPSVYCDENSVLKSLCFFQIQTEEQLNDLSDIEARIHFSNNTANEGGGDLYGGTIDNCEVPINISIICRFDRDCIKSSGDVFNTMTMGDSELDIASVPLRICYCEHQTPDCSQSPSVELYPGENFDVFVSVFGQRNATVPTVIQAQLSENIKIEEFQDAQNTAKSQLCSKLSFTVFSAESERGNLTLSIDSPCDQNSLMMQIYMKKCPHGFQLSTPTNTCICDERLTEKILKFTEKCDIETGIVRPNGSEFWVGYDNDSDGLIVHPHCPFDYCTEVEQVVNVDDSDTQCNYNRTGKLCGGCGGNTSLVLGSSRCMQCSNSYLALIIPFALAGIALVLFLFILKLTVAVGTINGLIFYANLVQVNSSVFYKSVNTNILTVFISWLNLDLGIETCFYNGMDAYTKTWLQFVFPIYVWSLVGVIIFISHFSRKITSLLGSNPIAVMATLFLISYTKILRTIIAAFSFRYLQYPDGINVAVWAYDGNIEYFSGKHTPLFITALLSLIFLFLPFTLLLFLGQWIQTLQAKTEWRILSWINKPTFRAFLDAYHAPYASSHRYWTGLLLLVRCILFIIFATTGDTRADLFAVSTAVTGLITFALATTGIYRNRYFGILEASFFLNLVLLTTATNHVQAAGGNQAAVTLISLSIAFITFAGIVIYHIYLQVRGTKLQGMVASQAKIYSTRLSVSKKNDDIELVGKEEKIASNEASITTSYVELREPLLDEN